MYEVFLDKCLLPITPDKIQTSINNNNKMITLINDGQVNILKKARLTDIEFDCMLPQVQYPFAVYKDGFQKAEYYLGYFEELKNSRKPFQFVVSRKLPSGKGIFGTDFTVSLEDYKIIEDAKNGFDLVVRVKLKKYIYYGTTTVTLTPDKKKGTAKKKREASTSPKPTSVKTHKVVKGDVLWKLSKYYYGDGSKYMKIYNANKDKLKNPNDLAIGQMLIIPV